MIGSAIRWFCANFAMIWVIFGSFLLVHRPIINWLEDKLVFGDDGYSRKLIEFRQNAYAQGMSNAEANDTLLVREAIARLRREASVNVIHNPAEWSDEIAKAKISVANFLAETNPALVPAFAQAIHELPHHHIVYEDANRAIDEATADMVRKARSARPTADMWAAVNIVKPS